MNIDAITAQFKADGTFYQTAEINEHTAVIAYQKKFSLLWLATQLETYIIVADFADKAVDVRTLEKYTYEALEYAKAANGNRLKRLFSSFALIPVIITSDADAEAQNYCRKTKLGFTKGMIVTPVIIDSKRNELIRFSKYPLFGIIYYPYLKGLIDRLK